MRHLEVHEQFVKDLRVARLKGKHITKLFTYVGLLLYGQSLPPEARDHQLKGELKDAREFHIGGDIVVLYRADEDRVQLLRIGSHAKVLGM